MIVVVGLSHRSAPIEVRERLVLEAETLPDFLRELVARPEVGEALLVSTCNRVELVAAGRAGFDSNLSEVAKICVGALAVRAPGIEQHLYAHVGGAAVRHLFRVAASLDSMVVGEPQILGQVKDAYELARRVGTVGSVLHRTLPRAIRAAKRVRTETAIGNGQVSVPSVAVDLTRQIFGDLSGHVALLVGSGEMAEAVARLLKVAGAAIVVVGRTLARAEELAQTVGGKARPWTDLKQAVTDADVIVTSTSAPHHVIDYELVNSARRARRGKNQFFIDLAVPRDVDPKIEELDGAFLYNIDDLSKVVAETLSTRSREAASAEAIVGHEAEGYDRWADAEQATPTIVALRERLAAALEAEMNKSFRGRLKHLSADDRAAVAKMLESSVNRLLHQPTIRLRQAALERASEMLSLDQLSSAINELFAFDAESEAASAPDNVPPESDPPAPSDPNLALPSRARAVGSRR
ncbi:MAG TPA: glutamyl-tRNA reductase [Polyangiaceae bacterium]|nr:glutamyl-tRNA reductase [Polyangiaceae bacterium]